MTTHIRVLLGLMTGLVLTVAPGWAREATPAQTEGPYYPRTRPADTDADLTRIGTGPRAQGQVLELEGLLIDTADKPVGNARVELWQTDHQGIYLHPGDPQVKKRDAAFQGYGETRTDASGAFRFTTIVPGAYEGRPKHLHIKVTPTKGRGVTTQIYFKGDAELARDGIARSLGPALEQLSLTPEPVAGGDGAIRARVTLVVRAK